jgi:hypothetical protein
MVFRQADRRVKKPRVFAKVARIPPPISGHLKADPRAIAGAQISRLIQVDRCVRVAHTADGDRVN